ncbi:MAG: hypothetical protein J6C94_00085 [Alistipes sp.]|nr:hypothetical protein [Alistipes sp.]
MSYNKISIPKNGDGAGCATPKLSEIIIIDAADIKVEPTRTVGDTTMTGDFELLEGAKALSIYGTPSSIEYIEEHTGEADARGVKVGIAFEHPGNSKEIKSFNEAYMNRAVVALVKECDGSATGRTQAFGSKCNPLFLTTESTNNKEATKRKFTFKQEMADKFLPGDYTGAEPTLADKPTKTGQEGA